MSETDLACPTDPADKEDLGLSKSGEGTGPQFGSKVASPLSAGRKGPDPGARARASASSATARRRKSTRITAWTTRPWPWRPCRRAPCKGRRGATRTRAWWAAAPG